VPKQLSCSPDNSCCLVSHDEIDQRAVDAALLGRWHARGRGHQHVTWEQRFGALVALYGDEWDAAHERLEQEWLGAYTAAFVEIAVSRGWRRVGAGTRPVGIGG
jgi:hypothetical protein